MTRCRGTISPGSSARGETAGYAAVFLPEIAGRDAFVALGALAGETRDLLLGTGVVPMSSRTPPLTAMAAATVQERSRRARDPRPRDRGVP